FFYDVYRDQRVGLAENRLVFDKSSGKSYVAHSERHNRPFQGTSLGVKIECRPQRCRQALA
ncbi:hypothetical protein Lpp123_01594, partial [Lacticaseibacillus paracasei subsp. paracasei Lpp123]